MPIWTIFTDLAYLIIIFSIPLLLFTAFVAFYLASNVTITEEYVAILGSIFVYKKIPIKNITEYRHSYENELIVAGNPAHTKNSIL